MFLNKNHMTIFEKNREMLPDSNTANAGISARCKEQKYGVFKKIYTFLRLHFVAVNEIRNLSFL